MKVLRRGYFDPSTFCPEDIAKAALEWFHDCHSPSYLKKFYDQIDSTPEEFEAYIAELIGPMPDIKGTTIEFSYGGKDFFLHVRKDGTAKLTQG